MPPDRSRISAFYEGVLLVALGSIDHHYSSEARARARDSLYQIAHLCFDYYSRIQPQLKLIGGVPYMFLGQTNGVYYFFELEKSLLTNFGTFFGCRFGPRHGRQTTDQPPRLAYPSKALALIDSEIDIVQFAETEAEDAIFLSYVEHWRNFAHQRRQALLTAVAPRHQERFQDGEAPNQSAFHAAPGLWFGRWAHDSESGYEYLIGFDSAGRVTDSVSRRVKVLLESQKRVWEILEASDDFQERNKIVKWPEPRIIESNPFVFDQEIIGIQAKFVQMIESDKALETLNLR